MHHIKRTVLVPHSIEKMFDLITRVEDYPQFLPWCGGSTVHARDEQGLDASICIQFAGVRQMFRTRNTHTYPNLMLMQLVEGPFSSLEGRWELVALDEEACKIDFTLEYSFSSKTLAFVIGPIFGKISNSLVDAFIQEADKRYG